MPDIEVRDLSPRVEIREQVARVELRTQGQKGDKGDKGDPGSSGGGSSSTTITHPAGLDLSGFRVVAVRADNRVTYLDNATASDATLTALITTAAAAVDTDVVCQSWGEMTDNTWSWTPGAPIYVGANGVLTQVVPTSPGATFCRRIASAITATEILLDSQETVILN